MAGALIRVHVGKLRRSAPKCSPASIVTAVLAVESTLCPDVAAGSPCPKSEAEAAG